MRIAIVDDLVNERALLRNRLEQALNGRSVQTDICEYANGEAFILAAEKQRFSAAFLDIYMPGANGIDTARALRAFDPDCLLIFTTTSITRWKAFRCARCTILSSPSRKRT